MIDAFDPLVGRRVLGRYRVVKVLACGGQGMVYLARGEGAAGFARPVVVKRVLTQFQADAEKLDQLAREARITAQLRHPGVVSVLDFAHDGDAYTMVLEYVHGFDLRRWERYVRKTRGAFPVDLAVYVVLKVLEALEYAHTLSDPQGNNLGVIHRDISPSNVLIDIGGHVKLTDFGIARTADEQTTDTEVRSHIKGKLPYVAPELFRQVAPSVSSDVYACAVMLHEILLGNNEFRDSNAATVAGRVLRYVPTRLDEARPDVPRALAEVLARALEKDPERRYQSAGALADALRDAMPGDVGELRGHFCQTVRSDFENPRMARLLGAAELRTLERAWREWHSEEVAPVPPEVVEHVEARAETHRLTRIGWGAAAVAMGLVVAWLVAGGGTGPTAPRFVYVGDDGALREDARSGEAQPTVEVRAEERASPPTRAARLTQAFEARRTEVLRCFEEHGQGEGEAARELWVRFVVDEQGNVKRAKLSPDGLAHKPLGRCLSDVARDVRFGPQPSAVAFRIPIRASLHDM